jgi:hypothetical protein
MNTEAVECSFQRHRIPTEKTNTAITIVTTNNP